MTTYDLWTEASFDHEAASREAALARAEAEFGEVFPFIALARSADEFGHRLFLAGDRLEAIAASHGIEVEALHDLAVHRYRLMREALAEGQDPLGGLPLGGGGGGPEKPDEHDQGPDFAHGYSEVPCGPGSGPDPAVTRPRPPMSVPVQEATGMRRLADSSMMTPPYTAPQQPDTGTGSGSLDTGVAGNPGGTPPSLPAGVPPAMPRAAASADPVRRKVMAVTAAVSATNPHLPAAECERVARVVVGRYLKHADLDSSVMGDAPVESGGGGGHSGGGGGAFSHMLEGQGLRSMLPGMGGAGEAAGAGAGAGEAAEGLALLAL